MNAQLKEISEDNMKSFVDFVKDRARFTRSYAETFPVGSYKRLSTMQEARTLEDLVVVMERGDVGIAPYARNRP